VLRKRVKQLEAELAVWKKGNKLCGQSGDMGFELHALIEREHTLNAILKASPIGIGLARDRVIEWHNDAFARLTGYEGNALVGKNTRVLYPSDEEYERVGHELDRGLREEGIGKAEAQVLTQDGRTVPCSLRLSPLDPTDLSKGVIGTVMDSTECKEAQMALAASEQRFRRALEHIPDVVVMYDTDLRIRYINEATRKITGRPASDFIGRRDEEVWPPNVHETYMPTLRKAIRTRKIQHVDTDVVLPGRGLRNLRVTCVPVLDETQRVREVLGITHDFTEGNQAARRLREAFDIINKSPAVVFLWRNAEGWPVEYASDNVEELFGYTVEELLSGRVSYAETIHPDDLERVVTEVGHHSADAQSVRFSHEPYRIVTKSGETKWVDDRTFIRRDEQGRITHYQGMVLDVTERKLLGDQLRQSQKMEAIGTLAGGIAHDFNNLLYVILGNTELALDGTAKDSKAYDCLAQVCSAGKRAGDLVDRILTFSRSKEPKKEPVCVQSVATEVLGLLRGSLPSTIEIREEIDAECAEIVADHSEVYQVILNLCTNAFQAMRDGGGGLRLQLRETSICREEASRIPGIEAGRYAQLTVEDNGRGMEDSTVRRAFEPYFTTKEVGEGTGLGLATVHGIVKRLGGAITVSTELGKGTKFDVLFPVHKGSGPTTKGPAAEKERSGRKEHILFVDDEVSVAILGEASLRSLGYRATGFTDSRKALEAFRADPSRFDLVITDQTMPGLTGADLVKEMMLIRPDVPIIVCTGFSETLSREQAEAMGVREYLQKPILRKTLGRAVRRVLDAALAAEG